MLQFHFTLNPISQILRCLQTPKNWNAKQKSCHVLGTLYLEGSCIGKPFQNFTGVFGCILVRTWI